MVEEYMFSFENYRVMCKEILKTQLLCDYSTVLWESRKRFIILRHDVEFSVERAYHLGKVESDLGISSSFFFQLTNNAYNILSKKNLNLIRKLHNMGHYIGLHFHLNDMIDLDAISEKILFEIKLLSKYTEVDINRFSFHRPTSLVLKNNIIVPNIINAYAPTFFTYHEDGVDSSSESVKYIADSKNKWQYIHPFLYPSQEFFETFRQIQILCHPYSWTPQGFGTFMNLQSLIEEKRREFIETLNSETKYVKEYINEL